MEKTLHLLDQVLFNEQTSLVNSKNELERIYEERNNIWMDGYHFGNRKGLGYGFKLSHNIKDQYGTTESNKLDCKTFVISQSFPQHIWRVINWLCETQFDDDESEYERDYSVGLLLDQTKECIQLLEIEDSANLLPILRFIQKLIEGLVSEVETIEFVTSHTNNSGAGEQWKNTYLPLLNVLSISKLQKQRDCNFAANTILFLFENCNLLMNETGTKYFPFISNTLFKISRCVGSNTKLVVLREAFLMVHCAHLIDPVGTELLFLEIGKQFVETIQHYPNPSQNTELLLEFVLRRLSTSNLGIFNRSLSIQFCHKLLSNVDKCYRSRILTEKKEDLTLAFVEDLQSGLDKPHKRKYFNSDMYRFCSEGSIVHIYRAMNAIYSDFPSLHTFHNKAHKLAWINFLVGSKNAQLDPRERIISLFNSLHNFHGLLQLGHHLTYSFGLDWDVNEEEPKTFNVSAYSYIVQTLHCVLMEDQSQMASPCTEHLNLETYPYLLLSHAVGNLLSILKKFTNEKRRNTLKTSSIIDSDFMPIGENNDNVVSLIGFIKELLGTISIHYPNHVKIWLHIGHDLDSQLEKYQDPSIYKSM